MQIKIYTRWLISVTEFILVILKAEELIQRLILFHTGSLDVNTLGINHLKNHSCQETMHYDMNLR